MARFDRTIPPGGEGIIALKLNLMNFQGNIKKTAVVMTNDPQDPKLLLTMQGTVKTLIDFSPSSAVSFRGMSHNLTESIVDMTAVSQPFNIQKVETNLEGKISYEIEKVEEGKHYRLKVRNLVQKGNYNGFLRVFTDLAQKPQFLIRVNGFIEGEIAVKPQTVLVGRFAASQPVRQGKILVTSNRNQPFKITKVIYDEKLLKVAQQPLAKEAGFSLEISPIMEAVREGNRVQTVVSIETDATPQEKQEVQVHIQHGAQIPTTRPAEPSPGANRGQ